MNVAEKKWRRMKLFFFFSICSWKTDEERRLSVVVVLWCGVKRWHRVCKGSDCWCVNTAAISADFHPHGNSGPAALSSSLSPVFKLEKKHHGDDSHTNKTILDR